MAAKKATTESATRTCGCGCMRAIGPKATFAPGHDAKRKSALLRAVDAGDAEARAELIERGWYTEARLDQRVAKLDARAAKEQAA